MLFVDNIYNFLKKKIYIGFESLIRMLKWDDFSRHKILDYFKLFLHLIDPQSYLTDNLVSLLSFQIKKVFYSYLIFKAINTELEWVEFFAVA